MILPYLLILQQDACISANTSLQFQKGEWQSRESWKTYINVGGLHAQAVVSRDETADTSGDSSLDLLSFPVVKDYQRKLC